MKHYAEGAPAADGRFMSSLHLDQNNGSQQAGGAHARFRCVTVIIYCNDVAPGCGGETRFPVATAAAGSPLREAALGAVREGASSLFPAPADASGADGPGAATRHEAGVLLSAAERQARAHSLPLPRWPPPHVRPANPLHRGRRA